MSNMMFILEIMFSFMELTRFCSMSIGVNH